MKSQRLILILAALLLLSPSCRTISSLVHEGDVVAKAGKHKLYSPELDAHIPNGLSPEDSAKMAERYIRTWASDMLFMDEAEENMSKQDLDVSKELEDYRRSLIKYRYEQNYVNKMLDTSITSTEIKAYFDSHVDNFNLQRPIVKAVFISIPEGSPNIETIRKKISSDKDEDMSEVDSLTFASAIKTTDFDGKWVDVTLLAREFGTDWQTLQSKSKDGVVEIPDGNGNVDIAYIKSLMPAGETGPVEYYSEQIRDIILSRRKSELLSSLERELLENAGKNGKFETYSKNE